MSKYFVELMCEGQIEIQRTDNLSPEQLAEPGQVLINDPGIFVAEIDEAGAESLIDFLKSADDGWRDKWIGRLEAFAKILFKAGYEQAKRGGPNQHRRSR